MDETRRASCQQLDGDTWAAIDTPDDQQRPPDETITCNTTPELVYVREGVFLRPDEHSTIYGRVSLINQQSVLFFSWMPYNDGNTSGNTHHRYAIHPLPLGDVRSIARRAPALGWPHLVIVLSNGVSLPPLYFSTGGVKKMLSCLKEVRWSICVSAACSSACQSWVYAFLHLSLGPVQQGVALVKRLDDPNTMLLNDTTIDTLDTQQLHDLLLHQPPPEANALCPLPSSSRVLGLVIDQLRLLSPKLAQPCNNTPPKPSLLADTGVGTFELIDQPTGERVRVRPPPLSREEWALFFDAAGRLADEQGLRKRIFYGGVAPEVRPAAWKLLLGVHAPGWTAQQRASHDAVLRARYEALCAQWSGIDQRQASRFSKWRERRGRVDKDVRRTDRTHPRFAEEGGEGAAALRRVLLSHCMWNFDLGAMAVWVYLTVFEGCYVQHLVWKQSMVVYVCTQSLCVS